jgi:D-alanine-D-alanine ligase
MKVAILFDEIKPADVIEDRDVLQQVKCVADALKDLGHKYELIPCSLNLQKFRDEIAKSGCNIAFNVIGTLDSKDCLSFLPIAVLDAYSFPHTGPSADTLSVITRKQFMKGPLEQLGIPTPKVLGLYETRNQEGRKWIIKGAEEDGSFGMDDSCVVDDSGVLDKLEQWQKTTGRIPLAEEYIEGREFTVPYLCGAVLSPSEIVYRDYPDGKPKILAHNAKWEEDSFEHKHTDNVWEFSASDKPLIDLMKNYTARCINAFGLRGWGRIDYRVSEAGIPHCIDINANSFLAPDAWFAEAVQREGIQFNDVISRILNV